MGGERERGMVRGISESRKAVKTDVAGNSKIPGCCIFVATTIHLLDGYQTGYV